MISGQVFKVSAKILFFFFRSKSDTGSSGKSSEKIGKGLSKIKHGVLGKSIEGIVDNSVMDSAFDLADMYVRKKAFLCDTESDIYLFMLSLRSLIF